MIAVTWILSYVLAVSAAEMELTGLRSGKGHVAVSVFADSAREAYPGDASAAIRTFYLELNGKQSLKISLKDLPAGLYSVTVMHDEDSDHKFDSVLGIPAEGFGFSNNPTVYFGPPDFTKTLVNLEAKPVFEIQMKYLL